VSLACAAGVARAEPQDPMPAEAPAGEPADGAKSTDRAKPTDPAKSTEDAKPADETKPATKSKPSKKSSSKSSKSSATSSKSSPTSSKSSTTSSKSTKTTKKKTTAKSRKAATPAKRGSHHRDEHISTTTATTTEEPTDPSRYDQVAAPAQTPAVRYGSLSTDACFAELAHRKIAFERESARGVDAGLRLKGPLHGVTFKTNLPEKQRATSPWEIGDCRLILALDDFAEILGRYDIVEVRHYSMYRRPDESAQVTPGKRHNGAVAIDAAKFIDKDGAILDVDKHFNGAIGDKTCGDGAAPHPVTPEATKLRSILCDAVAAHLFNVVLTPNYNPPHHNHFHLEVTRGVTWFLVH
jgi:hypothetical protein